MKWFKKPKAKEETTSFKDVASAAERCLADIALIEQITILTPEEKEARRNDAYEVFNKVFSSYIRR